MKRLLDKILIAKKKINELYHQHNFTKPAVFGSVSRGEENEYSDIDMLYTPLEGASLISLVELQESLEKLFGRKVDLCSRDYIMPEFEPYIEQDKIELS